jgi:hypothetical protein
MFRRELILLCTETTDEMQMAVLTNVKNNNLQHLQKMRMQEQKQYYIWHQDM